MSIKGISWLGVQTEKFKEMCEFYESTLGLELIREENGFRAYDLENGDRIELFDSSVPYYDHFNTGPVAGFLVDDIEGYKNNMENKGIEFIGGIGGDPNRTQWAHFRGPDGNIYELKSNPKSS